MDVPHGDAVMSIIRECTYPFCNCEAMCGRDPAKKDESVRGLDDCPDYDEFEEGEEEMFAFTEADCGRWNNGVLTDSCSLLGSEDCDWGRPLRAILFKRNTGSDLK